METEERAPVTEIQEIGKRVRERREELRLTLRAAGAKAGLSHAYIGSIERGRDVAASAETLAKLAYALQVSPEWFGLEAPQQEQDLAHLPVAERRHALALRRVISAVRRLKQIDVKVDAEQAATGIEAASRATAENAAKLELLAGDLEQEVQKEEAAVIDRYHAIEHDEQEESAHLHDDDYY